MYVLNTYFEPTLILVNIYKNLCDVYMMKCEDLTE